MAQEDNPQYRLTDEEIAEFDKLDKARELAEMDWRTSFWLMKAPKEMLSWKPETNFFIDQPARRDRTFSSLKVNSVSLDGRKVTVTRGGSRRLANARYVVIAPREGPIKVRFQPTGSKKPADFEADPSEFIFFERFSVGNAIYAVHKGTEPREETRPESLE